MLIPIQYNDNESGEGVLECRRRGRCFIAGAFDIRPEPELNGVPPAKPFADRRMNGLPISRRTYELQEV